MARAKKTRTTSKSASGKSKSSSRKKPVEIKDLPVKSKGARDVKGGLLTTSTTKYGSTSLTKLGDGGTLIYVTMASGMIPKL